MAIDLSALFTKIGKALHALNQSNTACGATIPAEIEDYSDQFSTEPLDNISALEGLIDAVESFKDAGFSLNQAVRQSIETLIIETVTADEGVPNKDIDECLEYLYDSFVAQADDFDSSSVGDTPAYGGSNVGDGVLISTTLRADGRENEFVLAETLELECTAVSDDGSATFSIRGEREKDFLAPDWPGGSGVNTSITSNVGSSGGNLIGNSNFSTPDDVNDNLPQGWIATPATFGTTLILSDVEQQTVVISGTPTAGFYTLSYTNAASDVQTTVPLPYNASESTVQSALQSLVGLGAVTVATTGTSPNFTHTVTFVDVPNPSQLTSTSNLTGGTPNIAHNTTVAGNANAIRSARVLTIDSDGSENTALYFPVSLDPSTIYAFSLLLNVDSAPAAGVITCDLIDGIGGTVIADDQSNNNTHAIDVTALTSTHSLETDVFITPTTLPDTTYLRIYVSTDISNTSSVNLCEVQLREVSELYTDGVSVSLVAGATPAAIGDTATLAITNDRAGSLHEWMNRLFDLQSLRIKFPTTGSGSISDSLIA